jgi:hypothetical protein
MLPPYITNNLPLVASLVADPYHFQTLHGPLPIPGFNKIIGCQHQITQHYPEAEVEGKRNEMHICRFTEVMHDIVLFGGGVAGGGISFRKYVPFAATILDSIFTSVVFEGPGNISFSIRTPLGEMRMFMTNLPVEPFKQHVEVRGDEEQSDELTTLEIGTKAVQDAPPP